jgi:uncharacterized protein
VTSTTSLRARRDHFDAAFVKDVAHRPWPAPDRPWLMTQSWHDLPFAHWPIDPDHLRPHVPSFFQLDLFQGDAWLSIVPFFMTNVSLRGVPAVTWISEFPELNVRTYVDVGGRPGVFFFSLDAASRLAVKTARALLNLPYHTATMTVAPHPEGIRYESRRHHQRHHTHNRSDAELSAIYGPVGAPFEAAPGTIDYFLTERYCLYNVDRAGRPYRLDIHHPPWRLQSARAELTHNTMAEASNIRLPNHAPTLHFSKRQDVVAWAPATLVD